MKKLTRYFINGFIIFVPVAATIGLVKWTLDFVGSMMPFESEGVGLLVLILLIFLTGFFASNYLGKKIFELVDRLMARMPVIKLLYSALKDLVQAFAGNKKSFDQPVLVELVENGVKALGFITRDDVGDFGAVGHVAVYLPQSYNFAGQVLIFAPQPVRHPRPHAGEAGQREAGVHHEAGRAVQRGLAVHGCRGPAGSRRAGPRARRRGVRHGLPASAEPARGRRRRPGRRGAAGQGGT